MAYSTLYFLAKQQSICKIPYVHQLHLDSYICICLFHAAEFTLISHQYKGIQLGSTVTFSCLLSPEINAVDMQIQWFKGTDCVFLYKNREMKEGRGYKGRVSLFTQELDKGNIYLQLKESRESDIGHYLCQVTDGERMGKLTVRLWWRKYPKSTLTINVNSFSIESK